MPDAPDDHFLVSGVSNVVIAALPALYAWQLHTWLAATGVFVVTLLTLAGLAWAFILQGWSMRWLGRAKLALLVLLVVGIGMSGADLVALP